MSESPPRIERKIRIDQPGRAAIDWLQLEVGLSRQQLKRAMEHGAVWVRRGGKPKRLRRAKRQLLPGDELFLYYDPKVLAEQPPAAVLISDEGAFSVWHKHYGMRSQGSRWGDHTTIGRWAEKHLVPQRNAYLVHRLDRAASGLILLAHSKAMAASLSKLFAGRKVEKSYAVIVKGKFPDNPEGVLLDQLLDGKKAVSRAWLRAFDPSIDCSLLRVSIETGRKHQIRRHLAGAGTPVVGDRLYGIAGKEVDLQLQAVALVFPDPESRQLKRFELPSRYFLSLDSLSAASASTDHRRSS